MGSSPTSPTRAVSLSVKRLLYTQKTVGSIPTLPITLNVAHLQNKNIFLKLKHGQVAPPEAGRQVARRGGEVVTRLSAKQLCKGSIPFRASNKIRAGVAQW